MASLNKVLMIGNLCADVEMRAYPFSYYFLIPNVRVQATAHGL